MSEPSHPDFNLNPSLDRAALGASFAARGRVEIRDFLVPEEAEALRLHLLGRPDWNLVLNAREKVYEISRSRLGELTEAQKNQLDTLVCGSAKHSFQYRYETIRVPDDDACRSSADDLLTQFISFMSSEPVLGLLREITRFSDISFADGQATAYSPGHFLTKHDDDIEGKNRRAAYVLGLTPGWSADWGGLLMFHGDDGNIHEAFTPAMGALRIFAVPAPHSVSYVSPLAPMSRLSVTGWLRSKPH